MKLIKSWTFLDSHLGKICLVCLVEIEQNGRSEYVLLSEQTRFGNTADPIRVAEETLNAVGRILEDQK
jgi:hypothetical protein